MRDNRNELEESEPNHQANSERLFTPSAGTNKANEDLTDYMRDFFVSKDLQDADVDQILLNARKEQISKKIGFEPIIDPDSSLLNMTDDTVDMAKSAPIVHDNHSKEIDYMDRTFAHDSQDSP